MIFLNFKCLIKFHSQPLKCKQKNYAELQITDMLNSAKEMFKNIKKSDAEVASAEVREEVKEVRSEMAADGKDLDDEINKSFNLNLDKESLKKSKFSRATDWLSRKVGRK